MSRRAAAAAADTTERNRAALKTLTALPTNKTCADCKRNKHPRWASWNLGVFVCIRCSGIHRSLGVHISRVKSIDLDSWTDEQLASVVKWGNKRANRYWEAKLAEGHVPNEGKMESFIRTKYDSKRWCMDGPMPDPATLDEGEADDDVPLKVVQERARGNSVRNGGVAGGLGAPPPPAPRTRPQDVDLFGDPSGPVPARPSTTEPAVRASGPPKAPAAPPKQTRPGESLLGLDFFGGAASAPPRPSSTGASTPGAPGRTDLKQSILSLYASKPAPPPVQQQQQQQPQSNADFFGGMSSPPSTSQQPRQPSNAQALGGMGDAFSSLSFGSPQSMPAAKPAQFSGFSSPPSHTRQVSSGRPNPLSGGSFFDAKPAPPPKPTSPPSQTARKESFGGDFGDFSSATAASLPMPRAQPAPAAPSGGMNDLFGFSPPSAAPTAAPAAPLKPTTATAPPPMAARSLPPIQASSYASSTSNAFNLSSPTQPALPRPAPAPVSQASNFAADPWGGDNAWATPDPAPAPAPVSAPAATRTVQPAGFPAPVPSRVAPNSVQAPRVESAFDGGGWGDMESS
ncbi:ARF GAP with effector function(s), partial [Teratosphaeriaceae sp. CCFEE 6253]